MPTFTLDSPCSDCDIGDRDVCFLGGESIDWFCHWLIEGAEEGDDRLVTTCFCHNLKSFDAMPLLRWLHGQKVEPSIIMSGCKVMSIDLPKYKLRFLQALAIESLDNYFSRRTA